MKMNSPCMVSPTNSYQILSFQQYKIIVWIYVHWERLYLM